MSIRADHFEEFVVVPTLNYMAEATGNNRINSRAAIQLVMMTIAHESHLGEYLRQYPTGPARGLPQMEPITYADMWDSYLKNPSRRALADAVRDLASLRSIKQGVPDFSEIIGNLPFAVAMARVRYLPAPQILPLADDLEGLAAYHVKWYNRGGGAEAHELIRDYRRYVSKNIEPPRAGASS